MQGRGPSRVVSIEWDFVSYVEPAREKDGRVDKGVSEQGFPGLGLQAGFAWDLARRNVTDALSGKDICLLRAELA